MTKEQATKLLNIYGKAWMTRDPDLIVSIFTEDAIYGMQSSKILREI